MSFGFSPTDIFTLVKLATKTYQGWKNACGEYTDITSMLDGMCVLLARIRDESQKSGSVLASTTTEREELRDILRGCRKTVEELDTVVVRFKSLSSSRKKNWDRLCFGVKNLGDLRAKLIHHTTIITAYLETVGLGSLARIEDKLSAIPIDIQQKIDVLATEIRAGRREGSVMTTYEDDEKEVWKQFRRELITADGITSSTIHRYKPLIRQYLRKLADEGMLEEESPTLVGESEDLKFEDSPATSEASRMMHPDGMDISRSEIIQPGQEGFVLKMTLEPRQIVEGHHGAVLSSDTYKRSEDTEEILRSIRHRSLNRVIPWLSQLTRTEETEKANPGMRERPTEWQDRMDKLGCRYPQTGHLTFAGSRAIAEWINNQPRSRALEDTDWPNGIDGAGEDILAPSGLGKDRTTAQDTAPSGGNESRTRVKRASRRRLGRRQHAKVDATPSAENKDIGSRDDPLIRCFEGR